MIAGGSAGGGLAAGVALLARDRRGPAIGAQLLRRPMLDDRDATVSTHQMDAAGVWVRGSNRTGWSALLGDRYGTTTSRRTPRYALGMQFDALVGGWFDPRVRLLFPHATPEVEIS